MLEGYIQLFYLDKKIKFIGVRIFWVVIDKVKWATQRWTLKKTVKVQTSATALINSIGPSVPKDV